MYALPAYILRGDWEPESEVGEIQHGVVLGKTRTAAKRWLSAHRIRQKPAEKGSFWSGNIHWWRCRNGFRVLPYYHGK